MVKIFSNSYYLLLLISNAFINVYSWHSKCYSFKINYFSAWYNKELMKAVQFHNNNTTVFISLLTVQYPFVVQIKQSSANNA